MATEAEIKELRDVYDKARVVEKRSYRRMHAARMAFRRATKWWHRRKAQAEKAKRKLDRATLNGRERAVKWALDRVGTHESPGHPNTDDGGPIDKWNRAVGLAPGPYAYWCGSFCHAALKAGGLDFPDWIRYTPSIYTYASRKEFGLSIVDRDHVKPGDMVLMNFDGGVVDHVGLYIGDFKTVDGNTSPGDGGSPNNGGGVYIRYPRGSYTFVHVDYSKAPKKQAGVERH